MNVKRRDYYPYSLFNTCGNIFYWSKPKPLISGEKSQRNRGDFSVEYDKDLIKAIVRETIEELKRSGILKSFNELAYAEVTSVLTSYYKDGQTDTIVRNALKELESDIYYKIIPLYFDYNYTIEKIAEVFDVEVSTIRRNKKRLCLAIYDAIQ